MIVAEASPSARSPASHFAKRNFPASVMGPRCEFEPETCGARGAATGSRPRPAWLVLSVSRLPSSSCRPFSGGSVATAGRTRAAERSHDSSTFACRPLEVCACSPRASRCVPSSSATGPVPRAVPRLDHREQSTRRLGKPVDPPGFPRPRHGDECRPQAAVDRGRFSRDELDEEHVAVSEQRLARREDRVSERMSPPRALNGPSGDEGHEARQLRVGLEQEAVALERAQDAGRLPLDVAGRHAPRVPASKRSPCGALRPAPGERPAPAVGDRATEPARRRRALRSGVPSACGR